MLPSVVLTSPRLIRLHLLNARLKEDCGIPRNKHVVACIDMEHPGAMTHVKIETGDWYERYAAGNRWKFQAINDLTLIRELNSLL